MYRLTRPQLDARSFAELQKDGLGFTGGAVADKKDRDPRVALTIQFLLSMAIGVVLGEHDFLIPTELQNTSLLQGPRLVLSHEVSLDLSAVIALVSDITHEPLPTSVDEA